MTDKCLYKLGLQSEYESLCRGEEFNSTPAAGFIECEAPTVKWHEAPSDNIVRRAYKGGGRSLSEMFSERSSMSSLAYRLNSQRGLGTDAGSVRAN
jgi:hypothetical protein